MKPDNDSFGAGCAGIAGAVFVLPGVFAIISFLCSASPLSRFLSPRMEFDGAIAIFFMLSYWPIFGIGICFLVASLVLSDKKKGPKKGPPYFD